MSGKRAIAMVGLSVGASVFAFGGASVSADETAPLAGCGAGYELLTIEATWAKIDNRPYLAAGTWDAVKTAISDFDELNNNDHHLCSKKLGTNSGQDKKSGFLDHWSTNIKDNNAVGRL